MMGRRESCVNTYADDTVRLPLTIRRRMQLKLLLLTWNAKANKITYWISYSEIVCLALPCLEKRCYGNRYKTISKMVRGVVAFDRPTSTNDSSHAIQEREKKTQFGTIFHKLNYSRTVMWSVVVLCMNQTHKQSDRFSAGAVQLNFWLIVATFGYLYLGIHKH